VEKKIIAVIPARGGSKRVPRKNLLSLRGKPLIAHTIEHAKHSRLVGRIIVSTDDHEISEVAIQYGAEVIKRPPELSGDTASSEVALVHVVDWLAEKEKFEPDILVFCNVLQLEMKATSTMPLVYFWKIMLIRWFLLADSINTSGRCAMVRHLPSIMITGIDGGNRISLTRFWRTAPSMCLKRLY
jgi:hypothetical protein